MSTTADQTPVILGLSHSDLIYVFSSTNSGQNQFKFIADLKVDIAGVRTRVARVRSVLNTNSYGVLNASNIIKNYCVPTRVASDDSTTPIHFINGDRTSASSNNIDTLKVLEIEFGESYASGTISPDDYPNQSSYERYILLGATQVEDGLDWNFDDYVMDDSSAKFLTDAPRTQTIHADRVIGQTGQWFTLGFLNPSITGAVGQATRVYFVSKDSSGSTVDETFESIGAASANEEQAMKFVGVGSANLEENGNIDMTNPAYYEVYLADALGNAKSETFTFYLEDKECKYPMYQIAFLNRYGCWDYKLFNKKSQRSLSVQRSSFEKQYGNYTTANGSWSYDAWDGGKQTFNTRGTESITLSTDWISEAEAEWLEQLITSPEVYILDLGVYGTVNNASVKPISIKSSNYEIKTSVNDKLFNLTIEAELSNKRRLI